MEVGFQGHVDCVDGGISWRTLLGKTRSDRGADMKGLSTISFGSPARSLYNISRLRRSVFDFGEIAMATYGKHRLTRPSDPQF